ncbi:reverse transcriptase domain-containing protein [Tanacetum coccineum]
MYNKSTNEGVNEDAIVVPPFQSNISSLNNTLINLVQYGEARDWLDKEPPRSILTWDDLVSKFINQFFPPSKTTYLQNKITNFFQEPNETFNEAWELFKGLIRQCPHHGFSELHQLDTFYNSLNSNDQRLTLDSAPLTRAWQFSLDKMPQEGLAIIESKSKVRYSRSRATDSLEDKMTIKIKQMMNEMKALVVTTPAPVKAVEEVFSCKAITPTNLQVQVLYQAIPFQTQGTKPRQLQLVVVFLTMDLRFHRRCLERESEGDKDTEATGTEDIQPSSISSKNKTKDKEPIEEPSFVANKANLFVYTVETQQNKRFMKKDDILSSKVYGNAFAICIVRLFCV